MFFLWLYFFVDISAKTFTFLSHILKNVKIIKDLPKEKERLTDTCLDGQDTFKRLLDMLGINHALESQDFLS